MPDVEEHQNLNGPCMLHGKFDCLDCCPELYDYEMMGEELEE